MTRKMIAGLQVSLDESSVSGLQDCKLSEAKR